MDGPILTLMNAGIAEAFNERARQQNSKYNSEANKEAAYLNYMYGEKAADNAQQRQIDTYMKILAPQAQMQMYKEAGLSPALMYTSNGGTQGMGGASAPQGGGAGAQQGKIMNMASAMQYANVMAQNNMLNAQARKMNAEADVTEETGKEYAKANIAKLAEETNNLKVQRIGIEFDNVCKQIASEIAKETKDINIKTLEENCNNIHWQTEKLITEYQMNLQQIGFNSEAYNKMLQQMDLTIQKIAADIILTHAQTKLTQAEEKAKLTEIQQKWTGLIVELTNAKTQQDYYKTLREYIPKNFNLQLGMGIGESIINLAKGAASIYGIATGNPAATIVK